MIAKFGFDDTNIAVVVIVDTLHNQAPTKSSITKKDVMPIVDKFVEKKLKQEMHNEMMT